MVLSVILISTYNLRDTARPFSRSKLITYGEKSDYIFQYFEPKLYIYLYMSGPLFFFFNSFN